MSAPVDAKSADMSTRLALIENEFRIVHGIFQKFESALDKMTTISNDMQRLLAVHDRRIHEREAAEQEIFNGIEQRRAEYMRHAERVSEKMEKISGDLRAQVKSDFVEFSVNIKESLKDIEKNQQAFLTTVEKENVKADVKFKEFEVRIRDLERWRWFMVGGGAVIGFLVARWSFVASLFGAVAGGSAGG